MAAEILTMLKEEVPHLIPTKEGRALYRRCHEIVEAGVAPMSEMDEAHEAATKYVGSVGQMIWKESEYWKTHKPKDTNEDWIELKKHLAEKRKSRSRPFRNLPGFSEIVYKLGGVIKNGKTICRCPAHDDRSPSLSITEKDGKLLMHCFAGCTFDEILNAMKGMTNG